MKRHSDWLVLGLTIFLTACNPFTSLGKRHVVDYKLNPHPKQRYDISMTIANAPGLFASMEGLVQYDVSNRQCLPPPDSNPGGYSAHMTRHIPFLLTRVSETHYTGRVYADSMLDEDYHGRDVCHWKLIQARVHMKATGADGETLFIPSLPVEDLLSESAVTTYFWKGYYPRTDVENFPESGDTSLDNVPADKKGDFFSITLTPKEVQP